MEPSTVSQIQRNEMETLVSLTFDALIHNIKAFTPESFNSKPADGGWSAGQVTEHLNRSYAAIKALPEESKPVFRPLDANVPTPKAIFLDFGQKFDSAPHIIPPEGPYVPSDAAAAVGEVKSYMLDAARNHDLSVTCISEGFVDHTRLEWMHFAILHTQRHLRQIERLNGRR